MRRSCDEGQRAGLHHAHADHGDKCIGPTLGHRNTRFEPEMLGGFCC